MTIICLMMSFFNTKIGPFYTKKISFFYCSVLHFYGYQFEFNMANLKFYSLNISRINKLIKMSKILLVYIFVIKRDLHTNLSLFFLSGQKGRDAIKSAIAEYHKHTCIRFHPRTNEDTYISFYRGSG